MNWTIIFNRLFEIIDQQGPNYFSGPRFLRFVKELDPYFPDYYQYIEQRKGENKSTTRKNYFYDLLLSFEEEKRVRLIRRILQETRAENPTKVAELYSILGGESVGPTANVPEAQWNAERLNRLLDDIDESITTADYERAITLSYTCLEGFFGHSLNTTSRKRKT
ncbi:MAG TPA: hypothetical protein VN937_09060 [Blastocatellia bacterium]|nr:hypothetical protein [Blastocatellia bacterium]